MEQEIWKDIPGYEGYYQASNLGRVRDKKLLQIDHIDNNKLNNVFDNLQLLSQRENLSKGQMQKINKGSRFTGVSWNRAEKKWQSHIWTNGRLKNLGYYIDEYQAAQSYQKALDRINNRQLINN